MQPPLNKPPLTIGDVTYEIKDGIALVKRNARVNYGAESLKSKIMNRVEYTEGHSYPVIIYGQDMISMDKASREFLVGDGARNTISRAFVVEMAQARLQLNFFLETLTQPVPTKIFDNLNDAIEWSKQFRQS